MPRKLVDVDLILRPLLEPERPVLHPKPVHAAARRPAVQPYEERLLPRRVAFPGTSDGRTVGAGRVKEPGEQLVIVALAA